MNLSRICAVAAPVAFGALALLTLCDRAAAQAAPGSGEVERGRYLVLIGHCNNCHTAGYAAASGQVDESRWLTGNPVGWRGRQGTTYAINLRRFMQNLSVEDWLRAVPAMRSRAPMPWWSLRDTRDADLRAMYAYIRSLSPLGDPAPAFVPAGQVPPPPFQLLPDMSTDRAALPAPPRRPSPCR